MKLSEHYLCLYEAISDNQPLLPCKVTIQEISDILNCTKRHTKHLLKQLSEKEWVTWEVSPGRGKTPTLTFLLQQDELMVNIAKGLAEEGKFEKAFEALDQVDHVRRKEFHQWLGGQLGVATETRKAKELDVLRYPFYKCIKSLDPANLLSRHDVHIASHIFDTLVTFHPEKNQLLPQLAFYWESNDQGKTWIFHLRKGVKFHNGKELTADDVKYTFDRLKSLNEAHHDNNVYAIILNIIVSSKYVVQFILEEQNQLFPHYLSNHQTFIVPKDEVLNEKAIQQFSMHPIGTGPFRMVRHDDTMLILEAFDAYFLDRPYLDRVEIISLPELYPNQNEMINYWFNLGDKGQEENWQQIDRAEDGASYFTFNLNKKGIHQLLDFRKILYEALDIENMGEELAMPHFFPAYSFLPSKSKETKHKKQQVDLSQKLLQQTGYQGETITIYATALRPGANHFIEAQWLQTQWEKIGVNSEVKVVPIEELAKKEVLSQANIVVAGIALGNNKLLSLIKTYQIATAFILNMVGPDLREFVYDKLDAVKNDSNLDSQLITIMELEEKLHSEYALNLLHHRTHSAYINVGGTLKGANLNDCGRIDYKRLWFKKMGE